MRIKAELELEQWNLILEVLTLNDKPTISRIAIGFLKPQLDSEFQTQSDLDNVDKKL